MLIADDARKILQNLPMRLPKRLGLLNVKITSENKLMERETTIWLHTVNGDPRTGRDKREMRRELFKGEEEKEEQEDALDAMVMELGVQGVDRDATMWAQVTVEDPPSCAMPRAYLDGLSDVEFSLMSQEARHQTVMSRWDVHGTHTGTLLGHPPTGRTVTVAGVTLMKFGPTPDNDEQEKDCWIALEEWTYWDLPGLLEQLRGTQ